MEVSDMKDVEKVIDRLEQYISHREKKNENVSKATVGWQIEHALKVIIGVCKVLENSDPKDFEQKINLKRSLILTFNWFPRGKAKAPKVTRPQADSSTEEINTHLKLARQSIQILNELPAKAFFEHPLFGKLNLKQSKRFFVVHTSHHLSIIKDIIG